jgi:3-oxoacyl-[acyl-carrier protein] reductase
MGRRVLVTGASRGIGRETALALAADGHDIAVHCKSRIDSAQEVVRLIEAMNVKANLLQFDIGDREHTAATLAADLEANGPYYGVVYNAGINRDNAFPAMTAEEWDGVVHTNLDGFYNVLHPLIMPMVREKKGGRIVVISSLAGQVGNRGQVNYSASKGGLIAAAKALAIELAKRRITVNCVAPGLVETEMTEGADMNEIMGMIPMRRMGRADEVAALVAYLFSDKAEYVTRQTIGINGGMV